MAIFAGTCATIRITPTPITLYERLCKLYSTYPEYRAMMAGIRDNWKDDLPKLVLADWFDEHREDEYATCIRRRVAIPNQQYPPKIQLPFATDLRNTGGFITQFWVKGKQISCLEPEVYGICALKYIRLVEWNCTIESYNGMQRGININTIGDIWYYVDTARLLSLTLLYGASRLVSGNTPTGIVYNVPFEPVRIYALNNDIEKLISVAAIKYLKVQHDRKYSPPNATESPAVGE